MALQPSRYEIDKAIADIALIADDLPGVVVIHNVLKSSVEWISKKGLIEFGITLEEIVDKDLEELFIPDHGLSHSLKMFDRLQRNNDDEALTFFQQVRFSEKQDWTWYLSSIRIFRRDKQGCPFLTITMSFPIHAMDHMTAKASRLMEEHNFLHSNAQKFALLSKRECEILRLMALGKSALDTSDELCIAKFTVDTHRKNIKRKLETGSYYELCQYARAFDLI